MTDPVCHVLFLCTGNSARSILAEALLNHLGRPRFQGHSAGSHPVGRVNPLALATLAQHGIGAGQLRSKSWEEFAEPGHSSSMDVIITVCDDAAGELCPVWPGHPLTAHWGIPDPASVQGSDAEKQRAFSEAFDTLQSRIRQLVDMPAGPLDAASIRQRLQLIGRGSAPA
jgi:arsenate reductase (thioredoxin)